MDCLCGFSEGSLIQGLMLMVLHLLLLLHMSAKGKNCTVAAIVTAVLSDPTNILCTNSIITALTSQT